MEFSPFSYYLFLLRPRYSPQHPILRRSKLMFLPQFERPSFTPIHTNRQIYISPRYGESSGCGWRNNLQYGG